MLNQGLHYTIQYLEPNTKSRRGGNHPPLVADVTINSLVALRLILLTHLPPTLRKRNVLFKTCELQDIKIRHKFICTLLTVCLQSLLIANTILFACVS